MLRLRLIGQMEAWTVGSQSVLPTGRKTRALLAVVALSGPRPALRGRLAELLWSRRPEEQARASLRQEIHRLLEVLSPAGADEVLQVTRDHLSLAPGSTWIDVEEVMRATVQQPASLSLLDGDLLEDLDGTDPAFDTWLTTERERLRDRGRALAEQLLREQEDPDTTISAAQRLLTIDRAHEGAWRALMRAHAARGERGMAIQAYDRCRAVLADLLDAAPSAETQKLLSEIRGPSGSRLPLRPPAPPPEAEEPMAEPEPSGGTRGGAHVGVLPFQLVGTGEEEAHLAPGLAEEITAALSRFRWMFVVSSNSLARLSEETRDESAIRRAFGLDFLLNGSIQRVRTRLRVTARLLDLRAGNQVVWARRFDRQVNDLLSLQDEIAAEVVAQIDPEILLIEARRVTARPPVDPTAYDLVLRALPLMNRMERDSFMQAGDLLRQAMELEPEYAAAFAWAAYWHVFLVGQGWAEAPEESMAEGGRLAEAAIQFDPLDARALTIAGHVRAFLHHQLLEAASLHERALSLNPNLAMAWALSAATYAYMGELDEAERRNARYKELSPLDPYAFIFDSFFTLIYLLKRDYEAAVAAGRSATQMNQSLSAGFKPYLAALGHLGRRQEAAIALRRLLSIEPDFTVQRFLHSAPFVRDSDRENYAQGLRLAGVPEADSEASVVPLRA
ncbi:MAG TPA: BTAD domain-containing putative transcriptional regulator [Acetobacteraceae bacterium]|nr:BTAD domain-containing putative transcriptional regulator [Acetobacteraceae bacterium]